MRLATRKYIEKRLCEQRRYFDSRLDAIAKEMTLSQETLDHRMASTAEQLDHRLSAMNEFREALKDQTAHMATKEQVDQRDEAIIVRVRALEVSLPAQRALVALMITVVMTLLGLLIYHVKG